MNVSNGIGMVRALQKAKQIKVIITFKHAHLDYRFKTIRSIASNLGKAINGLEKMLDDDRTPIAGFLTKSPDTVEVVQNVFKKAFEVQKDETSDNENVYFKSLLYKLGECGPLFRIHIDPKDLKANDKKRMEIVKELCKNSTYIDTPEETFTEFILDSSMYNLKDQIEIDYRTIENILNNDEYFSDPQYIEYVINILNNLQKLQEIIQNAGGKIIEGKLKACKDILKTKWNDKINKANDIISNTQDISVKLFNRNLSQFSKMQKSMAKSAKILKKFPKFYDDLMDIGCLINGSNDCFNREINVIMTHINNIKSQINNKLNNDEKNADDGNNDNNEDTYANQRDTENSLLCAIQKCCMLYKTFADTNKNIRKCFDSMKNDISSAIEDLCKKCGHFIDISMKSDDSATIIIYIFTKIGQMYHLLNNMESNLSSTNTEFKENDYNDDNNSSAEFSDNNNVNVKKPKVYFSIVKTVNKLQEIVKKNIKKVSKSFKLQDINDELDNDELNESASAVGGRVKKRDSVLIVKMLQKGVRLTDDTTATRETELVNFSTWLINFYDTLCRTDTYEIDVFENLKSWMHTAQTKFMNLLSDSCVELIQISNDYLLNQGPDKWSTIKLLLKECESLRKVNEVANATSLEYFAVQSEFDSRRNELSTQAAELIRQFDNNNNDNNRKPFDWERIIRTANYLAGVGCDKDSNEIKQIYRKIEQHLDVLKNKAKSFVLSLERSDELNIIQNTMNELNKLQKLSELIQHMNLIINS